MDFPKARQCLAGAGGGQEASDREAPGTKAPPPTPATPLMLRQDASLPGVILSSLWSGWGSRRV